MLWDIFCRVIDNFGDIGVCWRLAADLASRDQHVRLWVDDASALKWMAPGALQGQCPGIRVLTWDDASQAQTLHALGRADVWIEAFGCELPEGFVTHHALDAQAPRPVWLNLEYLSAEAYVERSHGLPSPVLRGPAAGWTKYFFYPGFTEKTGGLLREASAQGSKAAAAQPPAWLPDLPSSISKDTPVRRISLFCYEPSLLGPMLEALAAHGHPTQLLVTQGRAAQAVRALWDDHTQKGTLSVHFLPWLTQPEFDVLLRHCDLNFVRGEDSVLRALWAGKPFVWHIYPQEDGADQPKLEAFMEQLQLSAPVRDLHRAWNGMPGVSPNATPLQVLHPDSAMAWRAQVQTARDKLLKMEDLSSQLLQFVQKNR